MFRFLLEKTWPGYQQPGPRNHQIQIIQIQIQDAKIVVFLSKHVDILIGPIRINRSLEWKFSLGVHFSYGRPFLEHQK
jgi:hypothetical protein